MNSTFYLILQFQLQMALSAVFLHGCDSSVRLGRISTTRMSHEDLMGYFLQNISSKAISWDIRTPACGWRHLNCDDEPFVSHLFFRSVALYGNPKWEYLPSTLSVMNLGNNYLHRSVSFHYLPRGLKRINLSCNKFSGNICLSELPPELGTLTLSSNLFSGHLDFRGLPRTLTSVQFDQNRFEEATNLDVLPEKLDLLYIHDNPPLRGIFRRSLLPPNLLPGITFQFQHTRVVEESSCFLM